MALRVPDAQHAMTGREIELGRDVRHLAALGGVEVVAGTEVGARVLPLRIEEQRVDAVVDVVVMDDVAPRKRGLGNRRPGP